MSKFCGAKLSSLMAKRTAPRISPSSILADTHDANEGLFLIIAFSGIDLFCFVNDTEGKSPMALFTLPARLDK